MAMSPGQLETRIQELIEGVLAEERWPELRDELIGSAEARELYCTHVRLHALLDRRVKGLKAVLAHESLIPVEEFEHDRRRKALHHAILAAAAVLLVSAVVLWLKMLPQSPATFAEFRIAPGSAFTLTHTGDDDAPIGNMLIEGSRLRLTRGTMEGLLGSGVRCVIEAPCDLSFLAEDRISIAEGVAWFGVPPEAIGFTVETPQLTVVDLGTEFGVVALAGGRHEVHVIKGSVEITSRQSGEAKQILRVGEARRVDARGKLREATFAADRFTTALPEVITIANPNFDLPVADAGYNDSDAYGLVRDWAVSGEGVGVSDKSQPFLNQDAHSGTHAVFMQGRYSIAQSVSGFDPTRLYTVSYFVSERGLPGAVTSTSVSLDLGESSYALSGSVIKTDAFRRIVSGPLSVFGPTANVEIHATTISGDAALLVDSVRIFRAVPPVVDGGFENPVQPSGDFKQAVGPGGGSLIGAAWSFAGGGGITDNGSRFVPPPAPEGSQAAILQGATAEFSATVSGFEAGVTYSLSLEAAGRSGGTFQVRLGGRLLEFDGLETLSPAIGPYASFTSDEFTTTGGSLVLSFEATGKGTSFVDDIRFNFVAEATE